MIKNKIYLVNNKKKEPEFKKTFKKIASEAKRDFTEISVLDCAFSYSRTDGKTKIYNLGKPLSLNSTSWFIRAWSPSEDATALLCILLELHKTPFTDAKVNTSHEIRTSKLSQTFQLAASNCPCPNTWVVPLASFSTYKTIVAKELGFPLVVKTRGGLGKRVWKCDSASELSKAISRITAEGNDDLVILQENIVNDGDIRVVVWKGKVLASILRQSTTGFLNNVSQGGTASLTTITAAERRLAIASSKAVGLDLAGVDLVRTGNETLIFEVNKAPDITSFHDAARSDIAKIICEDFISKN